MEFRLLGPVELWAHGEEIPLPSTKVKQLLAALLWDPGETVSNVAIIRRLWDEDAPPSERKSLHANVSRLRTCLAQCGDPGLQLEWVSLGYRLTVQPDCIDTVRFQRNVARATTAADNGDLDEAVRLLRAAEGLVHGEPLAGLPGSWASNKRSVLEERIEAAKLQRIGLQLAAHPEQARDVLPELRDLAARDELNEPLLELRLQALHLANRTAEALHAYGLYREGLRRRSGLNPGESLQSLYARLLRAETQRTPSRRPSPASPAIGRPVARAPSTLERDPTGFVGRSADVASLTAEIDAQLEAGLTAVCVIDGMPGIGKSSLALHLSHRLLDRCPDGALQLHLRGHDESVRPTNTETSLDVLLRMLGVDLGKMQHATGLEHSTALWRRHTAGKRLLLFLDDAAESEQVLPLIPNGSGSIVVITARKRLTGISDAIHHSLAPMTDSESAELFVRSARMSRTSDPALHQVVAACSGFPMALCLAGTTLRFRSSWSISDLAEDLANAHGSQQLDSILAPAVYRSVTTSYRDLPEPERRLLRRLSLSPGTRFNLHTAAALADASPFEAHIALCNLVDQNLVREPVRRRYELHDMIRLFAAHVCRSDEEPAELDAAKDRLTRYTLGATEAATRLFLPQRQVSPGSGPQRTDSADEYGFSDARQATAWLDENHVWLRAVAAHWYENGAQPAAAALSHLLARYLDRKSLWKESISLHERGLATWRTLGDRVGEGRALIALAGAYWRLDSLDKSFAIAQDALSLWTALGNAGGEADALLQLGRVHYERHRHVEAIACLRRCIELREPDRETAEYAAVLHHLGVVESAAGNYKVSIATIERALRLARFTQDATIERNCINSLGNIKLRLGDYAGAESCYRQALSLSELVGDSRRIAFFAQNLGESMARQHRPEVALPLLERAFEIYQHIADRHRQVEVLVVQAYAELELGRTHSARALIDSAAAQAEQFDDPLLFASVYMVYGHIYVDAGEHDASLHAYHSALAYSRGADAPFRQADAYQCIGDVYEITRGREDARSYWHQALVLLGDYPSPKADALREKLAGPAPRRAAS